MARRGRVLLIDAVHEVARERATSFLKPRHVSRIMAAYATFTDEEDFAKVAPLVEIGARGFSLSIQLYVKRSGADAPNIWGAPE